ncbi:hypothetical protein [Paenibacillus sp. BAC0078]
MLPSLLTLQTYKYKNDLSISKISIAVHARDAKNISATPAESGSYSDALIAKRPVCFNNGISAVVTEQFHPRGSINGISAVVTEQFHPRGFNNGISAAFTEQFHPRGFNNGIFTVVTEQIRLRVR